MIAIGALLAMSLQAIAALPSGMSRSSYLLDRQGEQSCASCHGIDGGGGAEGGIGIPALTQVRTPDALCRAVRDGRGADGRTLSRAMPRRAVTDADCAAMWRYLRDAGPQTMAGIADDRFVVRLDLPPTVAPRWRARFAAMIDPVNAAGGVYGRQIVLADDGDAAIRIDLTGSDRRPWAGIDIALERSAAGPFQRSIESDRDTEREMLLREIARSGATSVVWLGGVAEDVTVAAARHGITVVQRERCSAKATLVVEQSASTLLDRDCANAPAAFVLLRTAPLSEAASMFKLRSETLPVIAVMPLPLLSDVVPDLLARITVETARRLGARFSDRRLLVAFDAAWASSAQGRTSLFSGIALQPLIVPSLRATGSLRWVTE